VIALLSVYTRVALATWPLRRDPTRVQQRPRWSRTSSPPPGRAGRGAALFNRPPATSRPRTFQPPFTQTRSPPKRAALQALLTDVANQDGRLAYDRFRAMGLKIGSGRVEAACKHVVGLRMKQSGVRWCRTGSQNTLSLRVAWRNGNWDRLWASHPLARAA
jgi:hypothetical protein